MAITKYVWTLTNANIRGHKPLYCNIILFSQGILIWIYDKTL